MKYGRYGWPYFWLRVGLGVTFLWIGVDILRQPDIWSGYVPADIPFGLTRDGALKLNGVFDIFIGLAFLANFWPRVIAWLAVLHIGAVIAVNGIDVALIRDVGLLGAALALAMWPYHRRRHNLSAKLFFWKKSSNSLED